MPFSRDGKECFSVEVGKLLGKGAMRRASFDINQFLSNQFKIPKKGDELRPVINLKPLNHFVEYLHFKMEGLSSLLVLINSNGYMITMDTRMLPIGLDPCRSLEIFTFLNGNQSYGNSVVFRLSCRGLLEYLLK